MGNAEHITLKPLNAESWPQFEALMGERGGCGGCWCMYFRLLPKDFSANKFEGNKHSMQQIVAAGQPTGLIALLHKEPVGWIALAPREAYSRIERNRSFKRTDDRPVWSITCFFVKKELRRQGLSRALIKSAIAYARKQKIKVLEAYPTIPYAEKVPAPFLWTGALSAFLDNGFSIVRQNAKTRAMVRLVL
jgi:GNAT superfamily N-acetyltransferase